MSAKSTATRSVESPSLHTMPSTVRPADILNANCPSRNVLRHITDRWTPMIVTVLTPRRPVRFKEIRTRVEGISPKVLTETLRSMERDGLVSREVTASVPPKVDYELTDLGMSISEPIAVIRQWAQSHVEQIEYNRAVYDAHMQQHKTG